MDEKIDPKTVTFLWEVVKKLDESLKRAATATQRNALPGARGKIMKPLTDANLLLKGISEVLERSGMDKKLGFIKTANGIQPVIAPPEPPPETLGSCGRQECRGVSNQVNHEFCPQCQDILDRHEQKIDTDAAGPAT